MELKPALKKLEESKDFKKWQKSNKNSYFSYAFKIREEMGKDDWQFGFYNKINDKITTFVVKENSIETRQEDDVFKKDGMQVNEIIIEKVKLAFDDAMAKSKEFQQKNYPKDESMKTIAILQNITGFGNVWNITFITEAFNTLNMKIDASTGKMLEHNLASIFSFRKE